MISPALEFEKPLLELEEKLENLRQYNSLHNAAELNYGIALMEEKLAQAKEKLFRHLQPFEIVQMARHPLRPHGLDYIDLICSRFMELHGDRRFADDRAIIGGFAMLGNRKIMVITTSKGRGLKENMESNFGCAHPEGYRKALRLMKLAEKARCPIVTFVDTPGAYPGIAAEERHIGEAIACNLRDMFRLTVPVVSIIIGEGGSGGALGLSIGNKVLMLENAYYSVITPEGCAAILWRNSEAAPQAAEALHLTSRDLLQMNIVDEIVAEPLGGAHRDYEATAAFLSQAINRNLDALCGLRPDELRKQRYERFRNLGAFMEPTLAEEASPQPITQ